MLTRLAKRCVELSYKHGLTHVSSVLNCVDIIDEIYQQRTENDPFILGAGHASLAHYVVLESRGGRDAEMMILKHGVHSWRDIENGIWCSNGSLGQAETVAVGFALANPNRQVWLLTSDGACMEGSVCEAMRFARKRCPNLRTYVAFNGLGAYGDINLGDIPFGTVVRTVGQDYPTWLKGLPGHYLKLTKEQCEELMA